MEQQQNKKKEIFKNILWISIFLVIISVGSLSQNDDLAGDLSVLDVIKTTILWPFKKVIRWFL